MPLHRSFVSLLLLYFLEPIKQQLKDSCISARLNRKSYKYIAIRKWQNEFSVPLPRTCPVCCSSTLCGYCVSRDNVLHVYTY